MITINNNDIYNDFVPLSNIKKLNQYCFLKGLEYPKNIYIYNPIYNTLTEISQSNIVAFEADHPSYKDKHYKVIPEPEIIINLVK